MGKTKLLIFLGTPKFSFTHCIVTGKVAALELVEKQKLVLGHENFEFSKSDIFELRNSVLGVGCTGIINNLITLFLESDQAHYLKNAS